MTLRQGVAYIATAIGVLFGLAATYWLTQYLYADWGVFALQNLIVAVVIAAFFIGLGGVINRDPGGTS